MKTLTMFMKTTMAAAFVAVAVPATSIAQDAPTDAGREMLLEGTPPTAGAEVPSAPPDQQPLTNTAPLGGVELETLDDAVGSSPSVGGNISPDWVGLDVVGPAGAPLGEVEDVIMGAGGAPEALIVRRPDGTMQTASMEGLTYEDGRVVADDTVLE